MKQIDFAKPLRLHGDKVTVLKEGVTLVRFHGDTYVVDEYGYFQKTAPYGGGLSRIENVPEPNKDHLCIWVKDPVDGKAGIDALDGSQLQTKETWAHQFGPRIGRDIILVKVPV